MKFGVFHLMEQPFSKSEPEVCREHLAWMRLAGEVMPALRRESVSAAVAAG